MDYATYLGQRDPIHSDICEFLTGTTPMPGAQAGRRTHSASIQVNREVLQFPFLHGLIQPFDPFFDLTLGGVLALHICCLM